MYVSPCSMPVPVALALHAIMHNQAMVEDWGLLDARSREIGIETLLDEIMETLRLNGVPAERLPDERAWWARELRRTN